MKVGVVTGLAREVDCVEFKQENLHISCAGASPEKAEKCAEQLVSQGCNALVSFGIAGALSPDLKVGGIVVSTAVLTPDDQKLPAAGNWQQKLMDILPRSSGSTHNGLVLGFDTPVVTAHSKEILFRKSGALCVDMESHRVAIVAKKYGLPYIVIRVISDDASRTLPSAALGVIGENGKPVFSKVIRNVLRHPGQIPDLLKLSKDLEVALEQLRRVSSLSGPLFSFA